jgi:DNA adenine methylase
MISFYGGKNKQSAWIYSFLSDELKKNIRTYVEPFSGAMWVYFNQDFSWCDQIIFNDLNRYLTNFYTCCSQEGFINLLNEMNEPGGLFYFEKGNENYIYEKEYERFKTIFKQCKQELYTDKKGQELDFKIPDYDLAWKYAMLVRHAFSSISHEKIGFSFSASSYKEGKPVPEPKIQILLRKLNQEKIQQKLRAITAFESLDFETLIPKYDSHHTFFYIDPPYFSTEGNYFRGDEHFGKEGHERLAKVLQNIKGFFALSYYDFEGLSEMYPKDKFHWEEKSFTRASTSVQKSGRDKKGYEVLIMNF